MANNIPEFKGTLAYGMSSRNDSKPGSKKSKNMVGDFSEAKKHEEAEKKRLDSLRRQRESFAQRQKTISLALNSIDSSLKKTIPLNRKLKFSSSSDEEEKINSRKIKTNENTALAANRKKLFDEDDNDEDIGFMAPNISSDKGSKLLQMQSKYGGIDQRFRLDERFLDEDNVNQGTVDAAANDAQPSLIQERRSNIRILEKVLGKPVQKESDDERPTKSKATPYLRFDPDNPAHKRFEMVDGDGSEINGEKDNSSEASSNSEDANDNTTAAVVPVGLDPEFAQSLRKKRDDGNVDGATKDGFSLRQLFGRNMEVSEEAKMEPSNPKAINMPTWQLPLMRVRYSSSEDEADGEEKLDDAAVQAVLEKPVKDSKQSQRRLFFLYDDSDERIAEGKRFRRTENMELIRQKWEKQRYGLIQFHKSRRKEAAKKQKIRNQREELKKAKDERKANKNTKFQQSNLVTEQSVKTDNSRPFVSKR